MKRMALVVNVDGKLMAEIVRTEACGKCGACGVKRGEKAHFPLPEGDYKEGDSVELTMSSNKLSLASLIAYGVPLAALIAGLFIGQALFDAEGAQALTAIICLALGCVWLKYSEKNRRAAGTFNYCAARKNESEVQED